LHQAEIPAIDDLVEPLIKTMLEPFHRNIRSFSPQEDRMGVRPFDPLMSEVLEMTKQLADDAYGLGGKSTARYEARSSIPIVLVGLAIFWGLVGLGLVVGGLLASRNDSSLLCLVPPGIVLVGVGVWAFTQWRLKRNLRALVFPDGLVHIRGTKTNVFRWDEIESVWQSAQKARPTSRAVYRAYTIADRNGRKAVFTSDFVGVQALGDTIQREVSERLLPHALEAFEAGETVRFGKLSLSQEGLSNDRETIPWDQVEEVKLERGIITVRKEGKWLSWANVTVGGTPNVLVFLTLVDRIIGVKH
jgi:hypothetical protein